MKKKGERVCGYAYETLCRILLLRCVMMKATPEDAIPGNNVVYA